MTQVVDRDALHEPTVLEKMRRLVKEKKKPKLKETSFIVSNFEPCEQVDQALGRLMKRVNVSESDDLTLQQSYIERRQEREINYNHFVSL